MNYWLDLFTGTTWDEFRKAGARISGFRERRRQSARNIKPGDVFLCYLTGVMHWVGALEVAGATMDASPIWASDAFPARFAVKPLVMLDPEYGVPMERFEAQLDFYRGPQDRGGFKGFLRGSPNLFKREGDGSIIIEALRQAERNPIRTRIDPRKLARKPSYFKVEFRKGKVAVPTVVSVPEQDDDDTAAFESKEPNQTIPTEPSTRHTEVQYHLFETRCRTGIGCLGGSQRPQQEIQKRTAWRDDKHAR
jgi:hypothetical protein